jgi:hypothetical protein
MDKIECGTCPEWKHEPDNRWWGKCPEVSEGLFRNVNAPACTRLTDNLRTQITTITEDIREHCRKCGGNGIGCDACDLATYMSLNADSVKEG